MFTLVRVPKDWANKGLYHTRQNGDLVQELYIRDADLVYEVTEHNNCFGQKWAFFIIECKELDNIRCGEASYTIADYRTDDKIYYDAVYISEMCEEFLKQKKPLPSKLENLLSDCLPRVFEGVIQWDSNGYDSAAIWSYYEWILKHIGKKASDFAEQSKIDKFFKEMCYIHDIWQLSKMLSSEAFLVSSEILENVEKSKKEVEETIKIVKELISKKSYKDITYTAGRMPIVTFDVKNTPCGNISIRINLENGFSVRMAMDYNCGCTLCCHNISKECEEFEDKFRQELCHCN